MATLYKVETRTLSGWEDAWSIDLEDGTSIPMRFHSIAQAQDEIDELLRDVKEAVAAGDMVEEYDPQDYRIVEVKQPAKEC